MTDPATTTFAELGLSAQRVKVLTELGYEVPTPIQERTIPILLSGSDVVGQAQTGTGKTAAFALPMLDKLDASLNEIQGLVLTPTRELAMQVAEAIHTYARGMNQVSVLPVYGGAPIVVQLKRLSRGVHIVVGTPGRLIDHLDRGSLKLDHIRMVVLDEADEMLKMGFLEEVEKILSLVPRPRQVALFSATMPDEVMRIAQRHLSSPKRVEIEHHAINAPAIEQRFLNLSEGQKLNALTQMLELEEYEAVLVFRRTRNGAAELAERLQARGFAAEAMHGDMTQSLREAVIRKVKNGQIEIVVATDVAARGLDLEQITHVVNYDIPNDVEVYVHRIGRTGRAGRSGVATLFITPRERRMMRDIERFTGTVIKPMKMPSGADVAARRISVFKESLRKNIQQGDLDLYVELVEQLADEGPFDLADVAAAAARLANGSRSLVGEADVPVVAESTETRSMRGKGRRESAGAAQRISAARETMSHSDAPRESRGPRVNDRDEARVRLTIAVGKKDGIRPGDIVGSIANEADVPGRDIGPIDIRDDVTIVVIPERFRDQVLSKVAGAKFRGKPLNIRVAGEGASGGFAPQRPSRKEEGAASGRPGYSSAGPRIAEGPRSRRTLTPDLGKFSKRTEGPRTGKPSAPRSAAGGTGGGEARRGYYSSVAGPDRRGGKAGSGKRFDRASPGKKKRR